MGNGASTDKTNVASLLSNVSSSSGGGNNDDAEKLRSLQRLRDALHPQASNEIRSLEVLKRAEHVEQIIVLFASHSTNDVAKTAASFNPPSRPSMEEIVWAGLLNLVKGEANTLTLARTHPEIVNLVITHLDRAGGQHTTMDHTTMDNLLKVANCLAKHAEIVTMMLSNEQSGTLLAALSRMTRELRGDHRVIVSRICFYLAIPPSTRHVVRQCSELMVSLTNNRTSAYGSVEGHAIFFSVIALVTLFGDSDDSTVLQTGSGVLTEAFDLVAQGLGRSWPLSKTIVAFRYLTVADRNRKFLWDQYGSQLLQRVISVLNRGIEEKDEEAAENAVYTLSQFSSDAGPLKWMQGNTMEFNSCLFRLNLRKNELGEAYKASQFWMLSVNPPKVKPMAAVVASSAASSSSTVMISYNWQYQKEARVIHSVLETLGCNVWRDEQDMKENIHDSMADAVGKSSVVLVLVSRSYKESANCKKEIEFAENNKRKLVPVVVEPGYAEHFKADGWLGLLLGSKLYYDVSQHGGSPVGMEQVMRALVAKELQVGAGSSSSTREGSELAATPIAPPSPSVAAAADAPAAAAADAPVAAAASRRDVPKNEREVSEWLIASEGASTADGEAIASKLAEDGFTDSEEDLKMLAGKSAAELKAVLGLTGKQAFKLEAALNHLFPN